MLWEVESTYRGIFPKLPTLQAGCGCRHGLGCGKGRSGPEELPRGQTPGEEPAQGRGWPEGLRGGVRAREGENLQPGLTPVVITQPAEAPSISHVASREHFWETGSYQDTQRWMESFYQPAFGTDTSLRGAAFPRALRTDARFCLKPF